MYALALELQASIDRRLGAEGAGEFREITGVARRVGGGAHVREPALDVEAGGDVGVVRPGEEVLEIGGVPAEQVGVDGALGLEAGAHDCVRTPVDAAELRARVEAGRRFIELSRERAATAKAMPTPRCDDALTGVLGSEAIVRRLEQELARAVRDRAELSIGLLDVDGLERVNECCGRAAGDAVLREVVGRATLLLRPFDVIGRLGGEEFLIILPKTGELDIASVLDRLRAAMKAEPFSHGGHELAVTVSAGGATGREEAAGELLAEAERTLAEAKAGGRDRVIAGRKIELEALRTRE